MSFDYTVPRCPFFFFFFSLRIRHGSCPQCRAGCSEDAADIVKLFLDKDNDNAARLAEQQAQTARDHAAVVKDLTDRVCALKEKAMADEAALKSRDEELKAMR
jgi:hypothetical protein